MASHPRAELVLEALDMAAQQRSPEETIHHPDQGSQYAAIASGMRRGDGGVRPSMGSVGDCFDNAMAESFFATLECELIEQESFSDRSEARLMVFICREGSYNPHRRHSAIDYHSPMTYEKIYDLQDAQEQTLLSERRPLAAV
ncbi:transposase InsO family protein [Salinibacter ruber]|jgi:transposase InsO family protein|nr:transposase InsO family protein [Salinibacter ruber]MCS3648470.1 transposase InsO family protein [Salinibacter ruber]MCS4051208.1 transposase InsO family protein [Salinibacter ruber]MCS4198256.1 transposase InsO family protein [Salinibacter ruber]